MSENYDLDFIGCQNHDSILGVGAEAVQVAAILSFAKSPWLIPNTMLQTPEKYNEIASSTFLSKARYDGGLYSEPFAIMNVLFDYSAAGEKERFCRENGLSITRVKRLVATVNNLRDRVASIMGMKVDRLVVTEPPRSMRREALMVSCSRFSILHQDLHSSSWCSAKPTICNASVGPSFHPRLYL